MVVWIPMARGAGTMATGADWIVCLTTVVYHGRERLQWWGDDSHVGITPHAAVTGKVSTTSTGKTTALRTTPRETKEATVKMVTGSQSRSSSKSPADKKESAEAAGLSEQMGGLIITEEASGFFFEDTAGRCLEPQSCR